MIFQSILIPDLYHCRPTADLEPVLSKKIELLTSMSTAHPPLDVGDCLITIGSLLGNLL
jgi:hypothetical protein